MSMRLVTAWALIWGLVAVARGQDQPARVVWGRFETAAEVAGWKTKAVTFEQAERFVSEGAHSGRIHFQKYMGKPDEEEWPRVSAYSADGPCPADWSGWGAVALDLSSTSPEGERIAVEIRDTAGQNGAVFSYVVPPGGTVHAVIPLEAQEGGVKFNPAHIVEFLIFMSHPGRDLDIFVDNVCLLRPEVGELETALKSMAVVVEGSTSGGPALREIRAAAASPTLTVGQIRPLIEKARQLEQQVIAQRIKPLRAFDFGPAGSPVRPGFAGVSGESVYSKKAGFGWRKTAGLHESASSAKREWEWSDYHQRKVPPRTYLNELTQDLVGGQGPAEFVVDVPAGEYSVWVLCGCTDDYGPVVNEFTIDAGAGQVQIGLPQAFVFESRFVSAKAGENGLVIRFAPQTGFIVNAIAVFRREDEKRARKEFAGPIEREIFQLPADLWAQWQLVDHTPEKPAPAPSAEERQRGYVLFSRPYVQNVYPDSQPQGAERFQTLKTFATAGEYEPVTFEMQALRDLENVTVSVGEGLAGPDGSIIPAGAFDLRQVRCWTVRTDYNASNTYKIVPEILDPLAPADLDGGTCRRFWFTVRIPDDAKPGWYRGNATVQAGNAPSASVPIELEVLPIRLLSDPTKSFGNYYDCPLDKITRDMSPAVVAAIKRRAEAEARDMQEHGMTTLQMGGISARKVNGQWDAVINMDERIEFLRRFGLWGKAPGVMMNAFFVDEICKSYTGRLWAKGLVGAKMPPQGYFDDVTRVIGQIEKTRIERGWPDFYYYPIDEACAEAVPVLAETLRAIKRVPTAKTYATQVFERPENRPLDEVLDVWNSSEFCTDLLAVDAMRRKGRIFWCYPNFVACSRGVPNSARMTYGFGLWRMGYSCLIPWHYQAPVANPFCDFDSTYGDWCMAYPGPGGKPLPTQRWEAVRQGIIDGKYLYTLETRLAEAKQRGGKAAAVAAGTTLLEELRQAVPVRATYDQDGPWAGAEYARYRRRLADAIIALEAR